MYLLMLLATFMSAIYGYNLSIRPDYDRDIPHKKALAVHFKFTHQHDAAKRIILNVMRGMYEEDIPWVLPGDLVYTDDDATKDDKQGLVLKQVHESGGELPVLVRKSKTETGDEEGDNIMRIGRTLYSSTEMASQLICPTDEIDEDDAAPMCDPKKDDDDHVIGTCCGKATSYFISYRKLDARWLNRLTNQVNSDFMWAVTKKDYAENLGVISWDDKQNTWVFIGKIKLYAVYRKDKEKFAETHKGDEVYPISKSHRTQWVMPNKVFTKDFFKYWDGKQIKDNLCDGGCLVKIEEL